jgi:hypothetical protein
MCWLSKVRSSERISHASSSLTLVASVHKCQILSSRRRDGTNFNLNHSVGRQTILAIGYSVSGIAFPAQSLGGCLVSFVWHPSVASDAVNRKKREWMDQLCVHKNAKGDDEVNYGDSPRFPLRSPIGAGTAVEKRLSVLARAH